MEHMGGIIIMTSVKHEGCITLLADSTSKYLVAKKPYLYEGSKRKGVNFVCVKERE